MSSNYPVCNGCATPRFLFDFQICAWVVDMISYTINWVSHLMTMQTQLLKFIKIMNRFEDNVVFLSSVMSNTGEAALHNSADPTGSGLC